MSYRLIGLLATTFMFMLTSCGSLHTTIEVINPQYLEIYKEQNTLRNQLNVTIGQTKANLKDDVRETKKNIEDFFKKTSVDEWKKNNCKVGSRLTPCVAAKSLAAIPTSSKFSSLFSDYIGEVNSYNQKILRVYNGLGEKSKAEIISGKKIISGKLVTLIKARTAIVNSFSGSINVYLKKTTTFATKGKNEINKIIAQAQSGQRKTLMGGRSSIESDALAFAVANAPKQALKKYNEAKIKATFGNADMIVRLDNNGDFTVKGMTFDPRAAAAIASKVTTQAIIMGAHIAGVPVNAPNAGDKDNPGYALASASSSLTAKEQRLRDAQAKKKDYYLALIEIAEAIIQEKRNIIPITAGSNPSIQGAATAIKTMFDSHASRLVFPSLREQEEQQ